MQCSRQESVPRDEGQVELHPEETVHTRRWCISSGWSAHNTCTRASQCPASDAIILAPRSSHIGRELRVELCPNRRKRNRRERERDRERKRERDREKSSAAGGVMGRDTRLIRGVVDRVRQPWSLSRLATRSPERKPEHCARWR